MSDKNMQSVGDLRVWWIPQVPMKRFFVPVESIKEAKKILNVLAMYDLFQLENNVKPDYCNVGGLEEFDGAEWCEWESEDGHNIGDVDENGGGSMSALLSRIPEWMFIAAVLALCASGEWIADSVAGVVTAQTQNERSR